MGLGDQIGEQAAVTLSAGLAQSVTALANGLNEFSDTMAKFLAEVDTDAVGAVDRLRDDLVTESTAWRAESSAWRETVNKLLSLKITVG